jgi:hypothetical protein
MSSTNVVAITSDKKSRNWTAKQKADQAKRMKDYWKARKQAEFKAKEAGFPIVKGKRGRKPWKRRPVVLLSLGHLQLIWMRKPQ